MKNNVYIVDDDNAILSSISSILVKEGYVVKTFNTPSSFQQAIQQTPPAVAILDIFFSNSPIGGEELIKIIADKFPNTQCIVISGESDIQRTLFCLSQGASDFLEKPVSLPRLLTAVRNASQIYNLKSTAREKSIILGNSRIMQQITAKLKKIATLNECVLLHGESGTGKELFAENLHLFSKRYSMPMTKVNCTSLNPNLLESELFGHKAGSFTGATSNKKGYFEKANGSSLFIDEIGDFPLTLQSKILRVIQEKIVTPVGSTDEIPIDTRLIFATHQNLKEMVKQGTFREDLFFRISTFTLEIPPLRERLDDIEILASHFLSLFLHENKLPIKEFTSDVFDTLKNYNYPGNIRELSKIIKNAAFFSDNLQLISSDFTFNNDADSTDIWYKTKQLSLFESKALFERELIVRRLSMMGNNIAKTAETLGLIKNNIYRKLNEYNIPY